MEEFPEGCLQLEVGENRVITKLGPVFTPGDLGKVLGWSTQKTRRLLKRSGLDMKGSNGRFVLTYTDLIQRAPELYHSLTIMGAIQFCDDGTP